MSDVLLKCRNTTLFCLLGNSVFSVFKFSLPAIRRGFISILVHQGLVCFIHTHFQFIGHWKSHETINDNSTNIDFGHVLSADSLHRSMKFVAKRWLCTLYVLLCLASFIKHVKYPTNVLWLPPFWKWYTIAIAAKYFIISSEFVLMFDHRKCSIMATIPLTEHQNRHCFLIIVICFLIFWLLYYIFKFSPSHTQRTHSISNAIIFGKCLLPKTRTWYLIALSTMSLI